MIPIPNTRMLELIPTFKVEHLTDCAGGRYESPWQRTAAEEAPVVAAEQDHIVRARRVHLPGQLTKWLMGGTPRRRRAAVGRRGFLFREVPS